ncbi:FAD-binding and (Fe-S)-binding domain-containing protein [Amycolatopsis jiangsuensis]|uniref:FAD/FMN-containing dehydrogenase/Fe-S oxidoreductase n=1 Tax=Amycolatopsis jiangsuensis TaxID=1181879 RepID=A0A840IQ86_9PSEU|nr:FAD-binding and (Fe-S)-binding domain-containing protein [Amycolatopsis jiangsuensis]MBB4684070.1 FAD/FMN-containing dehydrogenase/Fe-S oxidoreductase [Amycolatopsis jiangsuensis]
MSSPADPRPALQRALQAVVSGEVAGDPATLATHSTDASNYRHLPVLVVRPRSAEEVIAALRVCAAHGVPVLPRGAATSIGGQAANEAVLLDFTRHLDRILEIDVPARTARVEPGVVLDRLRERAAEHGLTFGPDPSTHSRCTIGGMIGNNACGSHSIAWGKTVDNVRSLEIALREGTRLDVGRTSPHELETLCARDDEVGRLYRSLRALRDEYLADIRTGFPRLPRRVSGYNLEYLLPENGFDVAKALVGTEGTCVTILSAVVELTEAPRYRALVVSGYDSSVAAADAVPELLGLPVLTMEGIERELVRALDARRPGDRSTLPDGDAWLYLETGGASAAEALARAREVAERAERGGGRVIVVADPQAQRKLWRIREEGAGLATRLADGSEAWSGWEDAAVPPERLGGYLREFESLLDKHGREGVVYGHFGDGCLHVRVDFPLAAAEARTAYRAFLTDAAELVVAHGGSLSGEHGDGQARAELLPLMFPPRLITAFTQFKAAFDPGNGMNPGRVVDPAPLDADLRTVVAPPVLPTRARLALHADGGDLAAASRRCVGVGKCVSASGSVMCPSFRATGEEQHSTRGRARLLFEMLAGDVITGGWRSAEVRDALDLCLGCKACKSDCPVGVDMASYRSEFLSRHYDHRVRPAAHYTMGALPRWLRLGAPLARMVNAVAASPARRLLARMGGLAPDRALPELAAPTFRAWFRARHAHRRASPASVVLWPDTFTNFFDPQVGRDAVAVLESLGQEVRLPERTVCCGLTWHSTGQLRTARRVLRRTLDALQPALEQGLPVIGLEPSCTAFLREDSAELLPDDPRVELLRRSVRTFAEHVGDVALPSAPTGRVLTQVHCHQHADLGYDADTRLLDRVSGEVRILREGCCGLAGNFGFERGHYDISVAVAEHQLLPALRSEPESTVVHADGFSCRTQIRQLAGREPVHLATLTARALGLSGG